MTAKPIVLSAIQPTSVPTLGNYLGAIRNWVEMQRDHFCYFFAVDLHALTTSQDPARLRELTLEIIAYNIASGLDPEQSVLFCQSHVPEHAELAWILNCFSYMGELNRMTQFKEKGQKQGSNIPVGLFTYPVLMAADILLYQTQKVPVGNDQKQHVELARNLAERFNNRFERPVFQIPEVAFGSVGTRVMDLQEPTNKMSKSASSPKGTVYLNDTDKQIAKKIKSAVTDSGSTISYDDEKKGLKNLIEIHCALSGKTPEEVVRSFEGKLYGHLKVETADLAIEKLGPIRDEANRLLQDKGQLLSILKTGAEKARGVAQETLTQVHDCVGLVAR